MTVTDMAHIVDCIKISATILVVQVLHRTSHNLERLLVGDAQKLAGVLCPLPANLLYTQSVRRETLLWNTYDEIRVGT